MTTPLGPTVGTDPTTATANPLGSALGKDDFLKLLVTQLRNQDPLSPMDGSQFAAQLAQFSTVEKLIEISSKLDAQTAATAASSLTTQTMLGNSLIGRDVLVRGATLTVNGERTPRVAFELDAAAANVVVEVIGANGKVAATQEFENLGAGRQVLDLNEVDLEAGNYSYKVTAITEDGEAIDADAYTVGRVDGVSFHGGDVGLRINGVLIPMVEILEVLAAGPAAEGIPTTEESSPQ